MTAFLLVNPRSGDATPSVDQLTAAAAAHGISAHVLRTGEDPGELARAAAADALGIAGGDGSLAPVAAAAIERDLPFVCVPFGTRNHFARDVGLDRSDPLGALAAFDGVERKVDVGSIGDRVFLNSVSIGLYAQLVRRREHHRRRREALAGLRALGLALRARRPVEVSLDGSRTSAPVIVVANNGYRLDLLSLGEREHLDGGLLHVYVASGLLPLRWEESTTGLLRLDARPPSLEVAIDGEPVQLETPLELAIRPRALRLLLPRAPG